MRSIDWEDDPPIIVKQTALPEITTKVLDAAITELAVKVKLLNQHNQQDADLKPICFGLLKAMSDAQVIITAFVCQEENI